MQRSEPVPLNDCTSMEFTQGYRAVFLCLGLAAVGYFDLETRVLEPLENPFAPTVLPMS